MTKIKTLRKKVKARMYLKEEQARIFQDTGKEVHIVPCYVCKEEGLSNTMTYLGKGTFSHDKCKPNIRKLIEE